jgi:hypothetical protein
MDDIFPKIIFVVLFVTVMHLHITVCGGMSLFLMRFIQVKSLTSKPKFQKRIQKNDTDNLAEEHGMTFAGFVSIFGTPYAVWYLADRSLFLIKNIFFLRNAQEIELMTRFADDVTLSTSNTTVDAENFPPPPGTYKQLFPYKPLEELWERHCEAERYLVEQCGVVFMPRLPDLDWPEADDINSSQRIPNAVLHAEMIDRVKANPFAVLYDDEYANLQRDSDSLSQAGVRLVQQTLRRSFRAQSRYMIGLFQWRWLFWGYWVFVRRIRNKTIEQLIAKGWYKHPQNLPPDYRRWYK